VVRAGVDGSGVGGDGRRVLRRRTDGARRRRPVRVATAAQGPAGSPAEHRRPPDRGDAHGRAPARGAGRLKLIGTGRTADVYALDEHRVLRRYRDPARAVVAREAAAIAHVAAHGFPAPAVFAADGTDLVMERLHGPVLLD